jgi:hypothetical protein
MTIWSILVPLAVALFGPPQPPMPGPVALPEVVAGQENPANHDWVFTAPVGHYQGVRK